MSHPTPLHPDADLAVVLDDLRQDVAAWGDQGMLTRVFRAGICLMLLSILDMLIELLADFRAGRLPPVLPALDRSRKPAEPEPVDQRTAPTPVPPADAADAQPRSAAAPAIRAPRAEAPCAAPAEAPEQGAPDAPRPPGSLRSPPRLVPLRTRDEPRVAAFYRSQVPRPRSRRTPGIAAAPWHAHFVTISIHSELA